VIVLVTVVIVGQNILLAILYSIVFSGLLTAFAAAVKTNAATEEAMKNVFNK
jgi:hypothetical protein